jgi:hypothetical protein
MSGDDPSGFANTFHTDSPLALPLIAAKKNPMTAREFQTLFLRRCFLAALIILTPFRQFLHRPKKYYHIPLLLSLYLQSLFFVQNLGFVQTQSQHPE